MTTTPRQRQAPRTTSSYYTDRYEAWVAQAEQFQRERQERVDQIMKLERSRGKDVVSAGFIAATDQYTQDRTTEWLRAMQMATMYGLGLSIERS